MAARCPCRMSLSLLLALLASAAAGGVEPPRRWTDAAGERTVQARLVTVQFGKIWLLRADGEMFGVAREELSEADRRYVDAVMARRRAAPPRRTENPPGRIPYRPGRRLALLENPEIDESSGLAVSRRRPGYFWTHNDSGADNRLFLVDRRGRDLGACRLDEAVLYDAEDMFSFVDQGRPRLVVCDIGNNGRAAAVQILYVLDEPDFDPRRGVLQHTATPVQTIFYAYEDDHRDCEAAGIDPTTKTILLATKEREPRCYVYALSWPEDDRPVARAARRIAVLSLPPVTALDVSPDGRRLVLATYDSAYEFVRSEGEAWDAALARAPREIILPERIQGESLCYGADGETLYLTSENRPTPLVEVPTAERDGAASRARR